MCLNKKWVIYVLLSGCLAGCNRIDDYMLGKDNTPQPSQLPELQSKLVIHNQWTTVIGKPHKTHVYFKLKPVVQGHIFYTADISGLVQAIDKNTGKILWSKQLSHEIVSGPTVGMGYIALGTSAANLVLLKQSNGQEVWKATVSGDILSKPLITHQKVLVKTIDGNMYAFVLATGEQKWMVEHGAPGLILKASSSPTLYGNLVLVGFSDGKLDAFDIESGQIMWQRSIAFASGSSDVERLVDIDADPIVEGGVAYLASYQGYVGALSLQDGQFTWRKRASVYKNMAMDANTLYLTDGDDVMWAFYRTTGQVKWKQEALKARGVTEPVLVGKYLVVGDKAGYLHVLTTQSGAMVSRKLLDGAIEIAPSVDNHSFYVMTANGKLHHLSLG